MSGLRIAIVGCGSVHRLHADAIMKLGNACLTAVCDIIPERAEKTAGECGCLAFTDFDSLMDYGGFDVLHICTPHYLHADMAIRAANAKKHVLCEKPMTISFNDALRVEEAVLHNDIKYGVCFQNRYNPSSVFIHDLLESGELGKVKAARAFVSWDRDEDYYAADKWRGKIATEGGGVLINQAIHTLDLMRWLVGKEASGVKASISTKRLCGFVETEDTADLLIDFGGGVRGLFYATLCYSGNSPVFLELACENGKIVMSDNVLVSQDGRPDRVIDIDRLPGEKAYWGSGHSMLISDFYDCLESGKSFMISASEAKVITKIVDSAYSCARKKA